MRTVVTMFSRNFGCLPRECSGRRYVESYPRGLPQKEVEGMRRSDGMWDVDIH